MNLTQLSRLLRFFKRIRQQYDISPLVAFRMALRCHRWIEEPVTKELSLYRPVWRFNGVDVYLARYPSNILMLNDFLYGWSYLPGSSAYRFRIIRV